MSKYNDHALKFGCTFDSTVTGRIELTSDVRMNLNPSTNLILEAYRNKTMSHPLLVVTKHIFQVTKPFFSTGKGKTSHLPSGHQISTCFVVTFFARIHKFPNKLEGTNTISDFFEESKLDLILTA